MKKIFFSFFIMSCFAFNEGDPKIQIYNYGHNGMEFVAREGKGMIIVSTYNSKMTIRQDIAYKIYQLYVNDFHFQTVSISDKFIANLFIPLTLYL